MAKQTGLGDRLIVGAYNLSGDIGSIGTVGGGNTPLEVTGIDASAMERIGGMRDGRIEYSAYFNDAAGQAHPVLSALPTSNVQVSYMRGAALGSPIASMVSKQINYDPTRGADGSLTFGVSAQANAYGLEWGRQLSSGVETLGSAGNGTSIDNAAGTSFGLQLYVHLLAFTGTSVTFKVQSSSDDGSGDSFADVTGATTTAMSAVGTQRVQTTRALAIERYLRLVTTGTFSNAQFVVNVVVNESAVNY